MNPPQRRNARARNGVAPQRPADLPQGSESGAALAAASAPLTLVLTFHPASAATEGGDTARGSVELRPSIDGLSGMQATRRPERAGSPWGPTRFFLPAVPFLALLPCRSSPDIPCYPGPAVFAEPVINLQRNYFQWQNIHLPDWLPGHLAIWPKRHS